MMKRASALCLAVAFGAFSAPAQSAVVVDVQQVGADLIAITSGSLNLSGLVFETQSTTFAGVNGGRGTFNSVSGGYDNYSGLSGPSDFGPGCCGGTFISASSSTGSLFRIISIGGGIAPVPVVGVSTTYVSGSSLSATTTFSGQTFAGLGITQGSYVYTVPADTITFNFGVGAIPEPSTWAMMIAGFGAIGSVLRSRRRLVAARLAF